MKQMIKRRVLLFLLSMLIVITGCGKRTETTEKKQNNAPEITIENPVEKEKSTDIVIGQPYETKEEVALYIHTFKELPPNYLTKKEASSLGWESHLGNLWDVTDRGVIGGDRFGNREGLLPKGETYYECDVNYEGGFRGGERLVYTKYGEVIYFTEDHYASFERLY